jgi:large subunit ribosomal protein L15
MAALGRRIIELQTSQALIHSPQQNPWPRNEKNRPLPDEFGRTPYVHPALDGVQGLTDEAESMVLNKQRLSQLAEKYGLDKVTRWVPKRVRITTFIYHAILTPPRRITSSDPVSNPSS